MRTKIFLIVIGFILAAGSGFAVGQSNCLGKVDVCKELADTYCKEIAEPCPEREPCAEPAPCPAAVPCPDVEEPVPCIQPKVEVTGFYVERDRWYERIGVTGGATYRFNDVTLDAEVCGYYSCKPTTATTDHRWAAHLGASYRLNSRWQAHVLATRDHGTWGATLLSTWWH